MGEDVLRHSQPLKLEPVATEKEYSELQSFKYHADPGQRVYIRFAAGLRSFGGYVLGKANAQTFSVPDYPKLLRFMADGSLLSLSGDRRVSLPAIISRMQNATTWSSLSVSVVSRNVSGMKLEIGRVLPDQLQHLVSFNEGSYAQPELNGSFSEDHIVERFQETRVFPLTGPGEAHYEGVDLGQYLKEGKHGIFLLHLSAYKPDAAKKADASQGAEGDADEDSGDESSSDNTDGHAVAPDSRLVVVTDLGMLAKRTLDGSRDVFVQSIRTGQPVGGASVSVLALNGQTLFAQTTSADGVAPYEGFPDPECIVTGMSMSWHTAQSRS